MCLGQPLRGCVSQPLRGCVGQPLRGCVGQPLRGCVGSRSAAVWARIQNIPKKVDFATWA